MPIRTGVDGSAEQPRSTGLLGRLPFDFYHWKSPDDSSMLTFRLSSPGRQIHPPTILFTTPETYLDELTKTPIDIKTLRGDWPFAWVYYDEPSNREALLHGRLAHNALLAAEQVYIAGHGTSQNRFAGG